MKLIVIETRDGNKVVLFIEDGEQPEGFMEESEVVVHEEVLVQDLPVPIGIRLISQRGG